MKILLIDNTKLDMNDFTRLLESKLHTMCDVLVADSTQQTIQLRICLKTIFFHLNQIFHTNFKIQVNAKCSLNVNKTNNLTVSKRF